MKYLKNTYEWVHFFVNLQTKKLKRTKKGSREIRIMKLVEKNFLRFNIYLQNLQNLVLKLRK